MVNARVRAAEVRLTILDVDGVLTDGRLYYGESGEHFRAFHVRDGLGIKLLHEQGVEVAVISGRKSRSLGDRLEPLGVKRIYQGQDDKRGAFAELLQALALTPAQVAYVGDDFQDLPVMRRVGLAATVADAHPVVQSHAHWIASCGGGRGAVRELSEFILDAQDKLQGLLQTQYLDLDC